MIREIKDPPRTFLPSLENVHPGIGEDLRERYEWKPGDPRRHPWEGLETELSSPLLRDDPSGTRSGVPISACHKVWCYVCGHFPFPYKNRRKYTCEHWVVGIKTDRDPMPFDYLESLQDPHDLFVLVPIGAYCTVLMRLAPIITADVVTGYEVFWDEENLGRITLREGRRVLRTMWRNFMIAHNDDHPCQSEWHSEYQTDLTEVDFFLRYTRAECIACCDAMERGIIPSVHRTSVYRTVTSRAKRGATKHSLMDPETKRAALELEAKLRAR